MHRLILSLLTFTALQFGFAPFSRAEDLFNVTLLGTGSPIPSRERNGPSTLIEVGGMRLIFDMGRGNTVSLNRAGIPMGSIDAHFLTHLHSDHINGLPDLYLTGWIGVPFGNRKKPFLVYGPTGTKSMMDHIYAAFSEDRRIRIEDEHNPPAGASVDAREFVAAGTVFEQNGVRVSAFPVFHGEHIQPAFGYKVEYKGHAVVLSGDTKYSKRVESEATGVDLLIHEVAAISGDNEKVFAQFPIYRTVMDHHTNPEEAGRLFSNAKPRLAVYSHIVVLGNPKAGLAEATPAEIFAQTRKTYGGPLVVGEDMMQFRISDEAVQQLKMSSNP